MTSYSDFIRDKIGSNWVVARRTPRILAKYGEDVFCISQQALRKIDREYRALYGDPYDKVRAQMYRALIAARENLEYSADTDSLALSEILDEAIKAEQDRP